MSPSSKRIAACLLMLLGLAVIGYAGVKFLSSGDGKKPSGATFTIGYEQYAPYISEENGHPAGLDQVLAEEIAKRNGWKLDTRLLSWQNSEKLLDSGAVDCLVSGVRLTSVRQAKQECTAPYLSSAEVVVVRKDSGIKKLDDLAGKRLAVQTTDPIYQSLQQGVYRRIGQNATLLSDSDFPRLKKWMESGKADALIADYYVAHANFGGNPDFMILPDPFYETRIVMVLRKGNLKLRDQVQRTLQKMNDDGTLRQLTAQWCEKARIQPPKASVPQTKKIMMIHSGNVYFTRSQQIFEGFSECLAAHECHAEYDVAGLNVFFRNNHTPEKNDLIEMQKRIDNGHFDMIVTNNNPATDLFLQGKLTAPHGIPVLCLSYHGDLARAIPRSMNLTGIETTATENDNFKLALQLMPDPDKIIYISEASSDGTSHSRAALPDLPEELRKRLVNVSGWKYSTDELLDLCSGLSSNSVIIISSWASVKDTRSEDVYSVLPRLRASTKALILGKYDSYLAGGADGGVMNFNRAQGEQAADLAERIFFGERAGDIPAVRSDVSAQIKYDALSRLSIPQANVPDSLAIVEVPPSWIVRWARELLAGMGIMAVVLILLTVFIVQKKLDYRKIFRLLQERDLTLNSIGDGVIVTDTEGKIVMINPVAEAMTGWTAKAAEGKPHTEIFQIVDYLSGQSVPSPVEKAMARKEIVALANHTDLVARNGKRYHIADSAAPIRTRDGKISGVILIFRDVTDEYNYRDRLRSYVRQMEVASDLAQLASFHGDPETLECTGSKLFPSLWPMRDGHVAKANEWICEEDYPEVRRLMTELYAGKIPEAVFSFKSDFFGATRHYRCAAVLSVDSSGKQWLDGVIQNVTRIVKEAQTHETDLSIWKLAIDSMPVMFFAKDVDDDFRYVLANRSFCDFIKTDRKQVIGHTDFEFPSNPGKYRREDEEVIRSGVPMQSEDRFKLENGEIKYLQSLKLPFAGADGRKLLLGVSADITQQRLLFYDLQTANAIMEEFFKTEDAGSAFDHVLRLLGEYTHATHCYIQIFDHAAMTAVCLAEYTAPPKENAVFKNAPAIPFDPNEPWYRCYQQERLIELPDIHVPDAAALLGWRNEKLLAAGAKSVHIAGILNHAAPEAEIGFIFENATMELSPRKTEFLRGIAHLIKIQLERIKAKKELAAKLLEIQTANQAKDVVLKDDEVLRSSLELMLKESDPKVAACEVIRAVCLHMDAPRGFIFKFNSAERTTVAMTEYSRDQEPLCQIGGQYPYIADIQFEQRFRDNAMLSLPRLQTETLAQPGVSAWADSIIRHGLRSLYTHRIMHDGKVWGFVALAYNTENRLNTESELNFFHAIAQHIELLLNRKHSDDRLRSALHDAEKADKAKSFFISSVSHELRTPLNTVLGFTELLRRGGVSKSETEDFLNAIQHSANALLQFISDVLELSQAETGTLRLMPENTNCRELCEEMLKVFSLKAAKKGIALHGETAPMPDLMLDKLRIRQILFNLLGNAVRFTDHGSVTLGMNFAPSETGGSGTLTIFVKDTGIGMNEHDRDMLMEPFARLSNYRGTNATNEGTGLGSALSRKLVLCMHGTIDLQSAPGQGSTFTITLPEVETVDGTSPVQTEAVSPAAPPAISCPPVLLVDDVPMNLKVLKAICIRLGASDVVTTESGAAALEELKKRPYGLVLTDMWMPEMTGEDLVREIRHREGLKHIPVVAITADVGADNSFDMSGFNSVILKPATLSKIEKILKMVS